MLKNITIHQIAPFISDSDNMHTLTGWAGCLPVESALDRAKPPFVCDILWLVQVIRFLFKSCHNNCWLDVNK